MEARAATVLTDVTPTGSQTQVLTPDEIPDQVMWMLSRLALFFKCTTTRTKTE